MTKDRIENETITIANENRKKRILTIDNDKDTSSSLKIVLEQSGLFEVDAFDDSTQALASFKSNGYDASGTCEPDAIPPRDILPTSENRTGKNIVCSGWSYACG
jgi:hypothetical protein